MKNKIIKIAKDLEQGTVTPEQAQNLLLGLFSVSGSLISDKKILDFLQDIMMDDNNYCEIYLAGLRNWTGKALAFQFETNPQKIPTIDKPTLREVIVEAMKIYKEL